MNKIQRGFAAIGFAAVAVSPSVAAAPAFQNASTRAVSAFGDDNRNFKTYYMEEDVGGDRSYTRARAFVDKAIGVTCEWTENGRRERDKDAVFHTVDLKDKKIGCVQNVNVPKSWEYAQIVDKTPPAVFTAQMQVNGFNPNNPEDHEKFNTLMRDIVGEVVQDKNDIQKLQETVVGENPNALPGFRIRHTWDLSANTVCLQTLEVPQGETGDVRKAFLNEWGCFPVTNKSYMDKVIKSAGMSPS